MARVRTLGCPGQGKPTPLQKTFKPRAVPLQWVVNRTTGSPCSGVALLAEVCWGSIHLKIIKSIRQFYGTFMLRAMI
jgi:hypothetical protein